jgi:DNA repair protein RecO (recombination protein O)
MLHKTKGIVLRTVAFGETSVVTTVYTQLFGKQVYLVNGVRSAKSKIKNLMQPLSQLEMVVYKREHKNLERIKEMKPAVLYQQIPFNMVHRSVGIFVTELLYKSITESETDEDFYFFLENWLLELDAAETVANDIAVRFMHQLSQYLGFYPQTNYATNNNLFDLQNGVFVSQPPNHLLYLNANDSLLLFQFLTHEKTINGIERKKILHVLEQYYKIHLPQFSMLSSPKILEEVLM